MSDELVKAEMKDVVVKQENPESEKMVIGYPGIAAKAFPNKSQEILQSAVDPEDVEIRPDGIVYLPEIKYRRVLNKAFGAGAWALMPRGEYNMQDNTLSREYAMFVYGRFVSEARGEQDYIPNNSEMSYATCTEGVKSNALMRCCKDLGIASELWDPGHNEAWKKKYAVQVWRKPRRDGKPQKPQWRRIDREPFYDESGPVQTQQNTYSGTKTGQNFSDGLLAADIETPKVQVEIVDDPFGPGVDEVEPKPSFRETEIDRKKAELKEIMALPCFTDDQRTVMADNAAKCKTLEGITKLVSRAMDHARKNVKAQAKADKEANLQAQLEISQE